MSRQSNNWTKLIIIFICLIFIFTAIGMADARKPNLHPFKDEVESLVLLKVLPAKSWNPAKPVTYKDYLQLIEKLFNGRSKISLVNLTEKLTFPDEPITYYDALTIAGMFLGYDKESSYAKVKEITEELKKSDSAQITGYEMAYIFYRLLYTNRVGQNKTLLEERYLVGSNEMVTSRVLQVKANEVILEDEGAIPLAPDLQVFHRKNNQIKPASFSNMAVGLSGLKFLFNEKGQVQTVILPEKLFPEKIRVLLSHELNNLGSSKSYDFKEIRIKANQPFKIITRKKGQERIILVAETGETITFTNQNGGIKIVTGNFSEIVKGRVYLKSYFKHNIHFDPLLSTPRHTNVVLYAGTLEIIPSNKAGYLYLINELPLEDYLKKVVPGQIPSRWGKEAFKVQAIAARSYAIAQVSRGKFNDKSANLDDSTASQLYNNFQENQIVNEAVDETRGIVAMHNGHVIDAVYFSTSAGYTANNEEVWHNSRTGSFPGEPIPYLRAKSQIIDVSVADLTNEKNALSFFKDQSLKSFDFASPYYRWKLELTRKELENTINKNLPLRERADQLLGTDFIKTITGKPVNPSDLQFSIGKLKDIRVIQRGEGGNVMVLDIVGTNGTYRVMKEYNIRFLIRPRKDMTGSSKDVILYCHDGSKIKNYSILPSAFFAFEIIRNGQNDIEKIIFYGGGNGHGVGMSQWGIKGMVDRGYTYEEILKHYYTDIVLKKIY
ncbi:hypothetical protein BBF96_07990 [Anoxybacter fermentans]|uniref:Sporulation stage II protein D amidase enhancer LytB N-terminal domain-containing protein n=1 Tax=Anoxybacter fermentans TaxID=1323375 RepID=A0A3Q9HQD2_9FIRM|nr:SpoIID/LytB domain-containing protein [Anoxybacter fermentans]AZR73327.1 hypothetical protein BBF96_07990 [Anoxybacter fermentans]